MYKLDNSGGILFQETGGSVGLGVSAIAANTLLQIQGQGNTVTTHSLRIENSDGDIGLLVHDANGVHLGRNTGTASDTVALRINCNRASDGIRMSMIPPDGSAQGLTDNNSVYLQFEDDGATARNHQLLWSRAYSLTAASYEVGTNVATNILSYVGYGTKAQTGRVTVSNIDHWTYGTFATLGVADRFQGGANSIFQIQTDRNSTALSLGIRTSSDGVAYADSWNWRLKDNHEFEHNFSLKSTGDFILNGTSSDVFVMDASTNRVGLGIAAPTAKLNIRGNGATNATTSFLVEDSAGVDYMQIRDDGSWKIGENHTTNAWTSQTVVIGLANTISHAASVIIGNSNVEENITVGSYRESIIIGASNTRLDDTPFGYSVIVGNASSATASGIAIGRDVEAGSGVSIGLQSDSTGGSVALGSNAIATGALSNAIGSGSQTGYRALAVGQAATAGTTSGQYNIAIGWNANADTANYGIAIGYLASTDTGSIVIGRAITDTGAATSIAIGTGANIASGQNISLGYYASNSGSEATSIGAGTEATAAGAIAMGRASAPVSNKMTNSTANSVGFGWEELTPSILFAKTADQYIAGSGPLAIGHKSPGANSTIDVDGMFFHRGSSGSQTLSPHIETYIGAVAQPAYQQLNWSQGNMSMGFGVYYNSGWKVGYASSQFHIYHQSNVFKIMGSSGGTLGAAANAPDGLAVNSNGRIKIGNVPRIGGATASSPLHVSGEGATSATSAMLIENSAGSDTLECRDDGVVIMANLPTSSAGLPAGALWNNSGVVNIV